MVSTKLEGKSIPSLELQAVVLGVECLIDIYDDLTGSTCTVPINITKLNLYCDSLVSLSWLDTDVNKFAKQQKRTIFVQNRIDQIKRLCKIKEITFKFISGVENPADYISRCISYKKLINTNYISGPPIDKLLNEDSNIMKVTIPNPLLSKINNVSFNASVKVENSKSDYFNSTRQGFYFF